MSRPARGTHGDYGYAKKHKCDCRPCRTARSRYVKQRTYERHNGIEARIDAAPLREFLFDLIEDGVQAFQIARAAGLVESQVKNILWGKDGTPAEWVHRGTAAKIEALTYEKCMDIPTLVDACGVHRRLDALQAYGHSVRAIADALAVTDSMVYQYLKSARCLTTTVDAVDRVYREMSQYPGDCQRTLWKHRRLNTPTPMCWDEEELDDPQATALPRRCLVSRCGRPASRATLCNTHYSDAACMGAFASKWKSRYREAVVQLSRRRGNVNSEALREAVAECVDLHGMSIDTTALHLGVSRDFVEKVRKERSGAAR